MVKEELRKETEVLAVDLKVINQKGRGRERDRVKKIEWRRDVESCQEESSTAKPVRNAIRKRKCNWKGERERDFCRDLNIIPER